MRVSYDWTWIMASLIIFCKQRKCWAPEVWWGRGLGTWRWARHFNAEMTTRRVNGWHNIHIDSYGNGNSMAILLSFSQPPFFVSAKKAFDSGWGKVCLKELESFIQRWNRLLGRGPAFHIWKYNRPKQWFQIWLITQDLLGMILQYRCLLPLLEVLVQYV